MRNKIIFCSFLLLMSGFSSLALSAEDRNVAVDQAIGGMEQGRRISSPGNYSNNGITSVNSGSASNPATDAHAHPFLQTSGNRGYLYSNAGQANGSQNAVNRIGSQQTSGALNASNASTGTNPSQAGSPINGRAAQSGAGGSTNVNTSQTGTVPSSVVNTGTQIGQTGTAQGAGTGETTPSAAGTVQAQTGQVSGTVNTGTQVGSVSGTTGSQTVGGLNVTTQPVTGTTGQIVSPTTGVQTGSSTSGTTTQGPSGSPSNPIVAVGANVNPSSGTPSAGVVVDTSGQLEDRQIVDAGVTGAGTDLPAGQAGSSGTQVGSVSGITGSQTVGSLDVTTQPIESVIPAPSDLSAEIDTTGQTAGGAADVGAEADVSGISEGSDVGSEPAAGLTSGTTIHTGL